MKIGLGYFLAATVFLLLLLFLSICICWTNMVGDIVWSIVHQEISSLLDWMWPAVGFVLYFVIALIWKRDIRLICVFTHEITHAIVGRILGRRIHSILAEDTGNGYTQSSGNFWSLIPVALAPYCLPIYTYALLLLRLLLYPGLGDWIIILDVLIGMSFAFHLYCFLTQASPEQSDIKMLPLFISYLYILAFFFFNFAIIILSYQSRSIASPDSEGNVLWAFPDFFILSWRMLTTL